MNDKPLNLSEISLLVKGDMSIEQFMNDERVQLFINRVETAGKTIMKRHGAGKYAMDAGDFIFGAVMTEFIVQGDLDNLMFMMENMIVFQKALSVAFIYSVGLGVVEELY